MLDIENPGCYFLDNMSIKCCAEFQCRN